MVDGKPPEARNTLIDSGSLFSHFRNPAASAGFLLCFMTTWAPPPFSELVAVPS